MNELSVRPRIYSESSEIVYISINKLNKITGVNGNAEQCSVSAPFNWSARHSFEMSIRASKIACKYNEEPNANLRTY